MEKLEHFWHVLLFEFSRVPKQLRRPKTFALYMGTMAVKRARQENSFLLLRRIVLTLVTLPCSERSSGFGEDSLNTMIHVSVLENWQLWWTMTIPSSCTICIYWTSSKIGCMVTTCSKPNPQNSAGGHDVHLCLLVIDWLLKYIEQSYPVSLLVTRNMS